MVQSIIDLGGNEDSFLEPELRPEYVVKLTSLRNEKAIPFKNIAELRNTIKC